mmetsp:Transcript_67446/g.179604  ORF Transcript_67446/g.179604 Transcript_67446/m.179604 type:complete len:330 (+) Transcript_67446:126-1115(+)
MRKVLQRFRCVPSCWKRQPLALTSDEFLQQPPPSRLLLSGGRADVHGAHHLFWRAHVVHAHKASPRGELPEAHGVCNMALFARRLPLALLLCSLELLVVLAIGGGPEAACICHGAVGHVALVLLPGAPDAHALLARARQHLGGLRGLRPDGLVLQPRRTINSHGSSRSLRLPPKLCCLRRAHRGAFLARSDHRVKRAPVVAAAEARRGVPVPHATGVGRQAGGTSACPRGRAPRGSLGFPRVVVAGLQRPVASYVHDRALLRVTLVRLPGVALAHAPSASAGEGDEGDLAACSRPEQGPEHGRPSMTAGGAEAPHGCRVERPADSNSCL